jgi:hypothetical protein
MAIAIRAAFASSVTAYAMTAQRRSRKPPAQRSARGHEAACQGAEHHDQEVDAGARGHDRETM